MHAVERSALVTYTPEQMFALVDDVARYPQFLPWCVGASVQAISPIERLARVDVAKSILRTSFTTRNRIEPGRSIRMELAEGPFKALRGEWLFEPIGALGSRIRFNLQFEFDSRLLAATLGSAFESICATMIDAFVARAKAVYG